MGEYYGVRREGEPYIEHFGLPKGWKKPNAKYIARMVTKSGAYRYIYNTAELAAAKAGKLATQAGNAANSAYRAVRKGANNAVTSAKKSLGVYARRDMNRKWDALASDRDPRSKAHSNKFGRFMESRRQYEKTPMGRLESLKNRAVEGAQQAYYKAEKKARNTIENYKDTYRLHGKPAIKKAQRKAEKAFNSGRKAVNDAAKNASKQANKLYKQAGRAANDAGRYVNKQVRGVRNAVEGYQKFRKLSPAEKTGAVLLDAAGNKKAKGARQAMKVWNMEQAIRNAPGNIAKAATDTYNDVSRAANKTYKQAKRTGRKIRRDVENDFQRTVRSTSTGRRVDDSLGLSKMGRLNKRTAQYKEEAIERRNLNPKKKKPKRIRRTGTGGRF